MYKSRRAKQLKVTYKWLMSRMRHILLQDMPPGFDPNKSHCRNSWARRFARRFRISLQRRSNKKCHTIYEKIHLVKNYHYFLLYKVQDPNKFPLPYMSLNNFMGNKIEMIIK